MDTTLGWSVTKSPTIDLPRIDADPVLAPARGIIIGCAVGSVIIFVLVLAGRALMRMI